MALRNSNKRLCCDYNTLEDAMQRFGLLEEIFRKYGIVCYSFFFVSIVFAGVNHPLPRNSEADEDDQSKLPHLLEILCHETGGREENGSPRCGTSLGEGVVGRTRSNEQGGGYFAFAHSPPPTWADASGTFRSVGQGVELPPASD